MNTTVLIKQVVMWVRRFWWASGPPQLLSGLLYVLDHRWGAARNEFRGELEGEDGVQNNMDSMSDDHLGDGMPMGSGAVHRAVGMCILCVQHV